MTSYRVENVHQELLEKLLADSGLECFRSPPISSEETTSSGSAEEQGPAEVEEEAPPEEEAEEQETFAIEEEAPDLLPEVFPSPSLRHMLSDKARAIERENRIHVLPDEFRTDIDPQAIPKILTTPQQKYIDTLAEMVGCKRYKSSLAEFWFLDTLANLLRRAQEDELDRPTQAILILWFCEWMKEMQQFDAADRERMMRRFQDNMIEAARYVVEMDHVPTPEQAGVYYKARDPTSTQRVFGSSSKLLAKSTMAEVKSKVHFGGSFECCIRDLAKIIHYIFDLFSTDYQYNLVRSVFTFSPDYALIDAPYQIQNPKKLYVQVKVKAKKIGEKSPRRDSKTGGKGKKKEATVNEEYIAFLEKKAAAERILQEQEEYDMEQWNLKNSILPLGRAATEEFFDKYWPPPPPPPPEEPPPPSTPKGKAPKKGKK